MSNPEEEGCEKMASECSFAMQCAFGKSGVSAGADF